ncbi:membrane protein [Xanthomonas maliensis]|uniref:membrane protein n=1 Tax=Xanthomonas maliensis TaxID=1321368 RepID=UPI0004CFDFAB|nr:membrane protein [Xanthomonas maliensis]KAB7766389.1 hypothetical protein CKY51_13910 [Xanthomonas maliensis]
MSSTPRAPAVPALSPQALLAYAAAHFGKSLLWYAGELLLIYWLTEHAGIAAFQAGLVLAAGFVASAVLGLMAARHLRRRLRDAASVGRLQWQALTAAALALLMVFAAQWLPVPWRLGYVLMVSLLFRLAYAACDVAQNTLLSLVAWPWRGHAGASALRLVGSGLAAILLSAMVGLLVAHGRHGGRDAFEAGALLTTIAVLCGGCLYWQLRHVAIGPSATPPAEPPRWPDLPWRPIALIATISLTLPTFTKLAPYVASGPLSPQWAGQVLIAYAAGTLLVQPAAVRWGIRWPPRQRLPWLAVALLLSAALFLLTVPSSPTLSLAAAAGIGAVGGTLGQLVWSWHAQLTARQAVTHHALSFATLTAGAQLGLAVGVVAIGLLLEAFGGPVGHRLWQPWAMVAGPIACAVLCLALTLLDGGRWLRQRTPAAAAAAPHPA